MSDKSNKPSKSDADEVIKAMQEDIWLLVAIIEKNQMEERIKGWKEIGEKRGLSTDAAKQRYEKLKRRYHKATDGVVPPKAIVKRRYRRPKPASLDDKDDGEEPDGGDDVPSANTAHLAPPSSARAHATRAVRTPRSSRVSRATLPTSGRTQGTKRSKPVDEESDDESDDDDDEDIPAVLSASAKRQRLSARFTTKPKNNSSNEAQDDGEGLPAAQKTPAALLLPKLHMPVRRHFAIEVAQMDRDSQARSRWRQEQERQDRVMRQNLGLPTGEQDEENEAALAAQDPALHDNNDTNEAESTPKQKKKKRTPVPKLADKHRKVAERLARQRKEDEEKGQKEEDDDE
ncbi:hypothetical protein PG997_009966 [Apiospora hydei]|uniref:Myb-like domain-containing protein n=1 Tax=Apiospora hydei TaxID=1337664 RepID=A0ABR1VZM5_9PEZI